MTDKITLKRRTGCNGLCPKCSNHCKENNQLIWLGDYDTIPEEFVPLESIEISIKKRAWIIGKK